MSTTDFGNNHTISQWVHKYGDALYSWASHKVRDNGIAEDLVQETYLSAFKAFDGFQGSSDPKTWLFKILNNKIIDHYRKSARSAESFCQSESFDLTEKMFDQNSNWTSNGLESRWENEQHLLDNVDFNKIFAICMADLPTDWNFAISSKYLIQKDAKLISQELGISSSNYWQVIHRAKLLLKKCLEMKWFEPSE